MVKKMSILLVLSLLIISFTGCQQNTWESPSTNKEDSQFVEYGVAGFITDIRISEDPSILGTILVEGSKDNGASYDKAVVSITPDTKIYSENSIDFQALEVQMYVEVFFDGPVRESYPVQATGKQINIVPKITLTDDTVEE